MLYKIGKKFFKFFANFLHALQVGLIFLAFSIILFWLLQLGQVPFIEPVAPFFDGIKNFIHLFYTRTVEVDQVKIDFSFLIASIICLLIVWGLKFAVEQVEYVEEKYDSVYRYLKKRTEDIFNAGLEQQYLFDEHKNNKFLVLVQFATKNLAKDSIYHKDAHVGEDQKQKEVLFDFFEMLDDVKCQKRTTKSGVLIYFDNFNDIDKVISSLDNILTELKRKYELEKWQIDSLIAIETYADEKEITLKLHNMTMLTNLGFKNKIACLASFKQRYSLLKNQKYTVEGKGIYKINKDEEVFCIKRI